MPPPAGDAGTDTGPAPTCETPPPPLMHGGAGVADPLGAAAGEVRAGRLTAAMLPTSSTGLGVWAAGDYVLANDRVAIMIEDAGPSDLYDRYGGRPVGVALVEGGAMVRPADFNEVLIGLATFLPLTERVSVVSDGSDGGPAVIRTTGPLGPIDFAGSLLDVFASSTDRFEGWNVAIDYSLAADAEMVEVSLHVLSEDGRARRASNLLLGFFQHFRMPTYVPDGAYGRRSGLQRYIAFDDPSGGTGWGWLPPEGRELNSLIEISGVNVVSMDSADIAACSQTDLELGAIVIGDGQAGVSAAIARSEGTALRTLTGTIDEPGGGSTADVRVHVEVGGVYYARTPVAADGTYTLEIPMAGAARASAYRRGFAVVSTDVPAGADPVADLTMPAFGELHVTVTDGGEAAPARIQVFPMTATPMRAPDDFGERPVTDGRDHVEFTVTGDHTFRVAPGSWRVVVSRGYEYELEDAMVTVTAGATTDHAVMLRHSVDTTGVLCADYHIHTTRSPDAEDSGDLKMRALVADGLEIAIRSDHEFVYSFAPVIDDLGVAPWVLGISGEELTTFEWGHFGVFPMTYDPAAPSGSAIPWVGRTPPPVFADVRARSEDPTLIINHPRTAGPGFGYFNVADYDPVTGTADREDFWDETFTVMEAFNDSSFEQNRDSTVVDWFSFLSHGRRVVAVGSSDSHHLYSAPTGYPRTCLLLGTDDPTMADAEDVSDATDAGHAYVSGGIYLEVEGPGGEGPGDSITGAGATAMFHVVVRAAEWIDVDSLEVIVDGMTTETITMPATAADPTIRFDSMVSVPVAAGAMGSWVVFHARGDEDMQDLHPGREPFAVSNAIFLTR